MTDDLDRVAQLQSLEATATQRQAAQNLYGLYVALVQSGFTAEQSLTIVISAIEQVIREV